MTLGERISINRKQLQFSQEQLADKIGVSRQAVSKWEQDIAQPELDKLISLARLFSVSTDLLLGLQTEDETKTITGPENDDMHTMIRFSRKLWHNIGYFLLVWGAAISIMALCIALVWQQKESIFVQSAFFIGLFAFVCGMVLVIFRIIRNNGNKI